MSQSVQKMKQLTSLLICCPLTRQVKGYPFEVNIAGNPTNVALADQVKSLDWVARQAIKKGQATNKELAEVKKKINLLLK